MKEFNYSQPTMITVMAQAIWDAERKLWVVDITQTDNGIIYPEEKYAVMQSNATVLVEDCDECVIADALYHMNGVDIESALQMPAGSLIKSED